MMMMMVLVMMVMMMAGPVTAKDRECLASEQVDITWTWPPVSVVVRAWVDPGTLQHTPILQLALNHTSSRPHLVTLTHGGFRIENDDGKEEWAGEGVGKGWVELNLTVTEKSMIIGRDSRPPLLNMSLPHTLHQVTLTASNLTAGCNSGQVIWRIQQESSWVGVPLAGEGESHPFLLYSRHPILPSLSLPEAEETFTLAWDPQHTRLHAMHFDNIHEYLTAFDHITSHARNQTHAPEDTATATSGDPLEASNTTTDIYTALNTTDNTNTELHAALSTTDNTNTELHAALNTTDDTLKPLPPYTKYSLSLECGGNGSEKSFVCEVKAEKQVLGSFTTPSRPWVLLVRSEGKEPFLLLQDTSRTPVSPHQLPQDTHTRPSPPANTTQPPQVLPSTGDPENPATFSPTPPGTTGGKGGVGNLPEGWSWWWVLLSVVLAILLVFVIIMCIVSHYHRPWLEKYLEDLHLIPEPSQEELEIQLCPERRPFLLRSVSVINTEDPKAAAPLRLWNAVASGDEGEVEQVMATLSPDPNSSLGGLDTTPYEEAHHRGHTCVLRVLEIAMNRRPDVPHNDMVLSVLQAHKKKVEAVFEAASGGQYRHTGGVDVLLRAYSLPGTLQDHLGCSLLHYAASVMLADGGPLWLAQDVRSLVESHGVLVNAVDFRGYTALHTLAEHAKNTEDITCWDGKTLSVCEAWLGLAELLMEVGCDPRALDHHYRTPHQLPMAARNPRLVALLLKAAADLGSTNTSSLEKFPEVVKAASMGDVVTLQRLLIGGARVLPLGGHGDPLLEAVRGGHRNIVYLLLAAGAPLCAHGLLGNTPFEAAHRTLGLPVFFPALIRKAFCDRLQCELEKLPVSDQQHTSTVEGLVHLRSIAEVSGHRLGEQLIAWREQNPSASPTSLGDTLSLAASLGLTLTCQLLGVAGVSLHPLPYLPHPMARALAHSHHHTAYSLCRDLRMNPYSAGVAAHTVSEQLAADLMESELHTFKRKLEKKGTTTAVSEDLLKQARGEHRSHTLKQLQTLLYLLAELNLVTLLHRVRQLAPDLDVNMRVHLGSASTMLHVAAAYGKMSMVEYLLGQGGDQTCLTRGGLAPAHLAALKGHGECVEYLVGCCRAETECGWGLTPSHLLQHFSENMKSRHLDLLTHEEAMAITGTRGELAKAQMILTKMCCKLGITSSTSLWDTLQEEESKIKEFSSAEMDSSILCDIEKLCQQIGKIDQRLIGKVVSYPAVRERTELMLPEHFEIYLELEHYSALKGGCVSVQNEDNSPKGHVTGVTSSKDQEFFSGSTLVDTFRKVAQEALAISSFTSLILVPPFLAHSSSGVCLHAALHCPTRVVLVRVALTPVIRVPVPLWVHHMTEKQHIQLEHITWEHMAAGSGGSWVYLINSAVEQVVRQAKQQEWKVLQACFYLTKLLEACWWLPKREKWNYGRAWHLLPVGVRVPPDSVLRSHFLAELMEEEEEAWSRKHWLSRVAGVFRRVSIPGTVQGTAGTLQPYGVMQAAHQFLMNFQENIDNHTAAT